MKKLTLLFALLCAAPSWGMDVSGVTPLIEASVTTGKLADGAVTTPKIHAEALYPFAGLLHVKPDSAGVTNYSTTAKGLRVEGSGSTGLNIATPDASNGHIVWTSPADDAYAQIDAGHNGDLMSIATLNTGAAMRFSTDNGSERIRIESGGNVGIGITNPVTLLHVQDADATTSKSQLGSAASAACRIFGDRDELGCTECNYLNGVQTCTIDSDCVCDGSVIND